MNIYVCVKHVPDSAATIKLNNPTEYDDGIKFTMNPYDEFAVEEALTLVASTSGEVILVTTGNADAVKTLRAGLAMGANRAIHVMNDQQFTDSRTIAEILAKAIAQDGDPGIIFCGKQTIDTEGMQTPYRLAAFLDIPVSTNIIAFQYNDGSVIVERDGEAGAHEVIEMQTPCVIGATCGLNKPRYPKMPDIMKAKKKEVKTVTTAELGIEITEQRVALVKMEMPPVKAPAKILQGDSAETAKQLVQLLHEEAQVV